MHRRSALIVNFSIFQLFHQLHNAIKRQKSYKAPGPDNIIPILSIIYIHSKFKPFKDMINSLLKKCDFPDTWKTARLALLPKQTKKPNSPKAYRPICMLNSMSKIYEFILNKRLFRVIPSHFQ